MLPFRNFLFLFYLLIFNFNFFNVIKNHFSSLYKYCAKNKAIKFHMQTINRQQSLHFYYWIVNIYFNLQKRHETEKCVQSNEFKFLKINSIIHWIYGTIKNCMWENPEHFMCNEDVELIKCDWDEVNIQI